MTTALCDPDAFYPFRSLVQGPLDDPQDLPKIERFIRSIVLHDDMEMIAEPFRANEEPEFHNGLEEDLEAGPRNIIVAVGPPWVNTSNTAYCSTPRTWVTVQE